MGRDGEVDLREPLCCLELRGERSSIWSTASWPRSAASSTASRSWACAAFEMSRKARRSSSSASVRAVLGRAVGVVEGSRVGLVVAAAARGREEPAREGERASRARFSAARRPRVPVSPPSRRLASWVRESRVPVGACGLSRPRCRVVLRRSAAAARAPRLPRRRIRPRRRQPSRPVLRRSPAAGRSSPTKSTRPSTARAGCPTHSSAGSEASGRASTPSRKRTAISSASSGSSATPARCTSTCAAIPARRRCRPATASRASAGRAGHEGGRRQDVDVYTVNRGADTWHVLYAWKDDGSLYTVSQHVVPELGLSYSKWWKSLDRIMGGLVKIEPQQS